MIILGHISISNETYSLYELYKYANSKKKAFK